ncbi:Histidine kinase [Chlorociboria aeruginascens]|nr:Histidine kinase [Chlorociboria aeruginascens]
MSASHQPNSPVTEMAATARTHSQDSPTSYQTNATSILLALQENSQVDNDHLEPLDTDELDPESFDLVAPPAGKQKLYSLEARSELLFSVEHLRSIFNDCLLLQQFSSFLSKHRPSSIPLLVYYLDATKALKALAYSNAVAQALQPLSGCDFTATTTKPIVNVDVEEKARLAFETLAQEDLPAYIAYLYTKTVSVTIQKRITGTLPLHLREASEGLAEVYCLTDPSRPDNPIVLASEVKEFSDLESLKRLVIMGEHEKAQEEKKPSTQEDENNDLKDELQELSEMLNMRELDTVRNDGGKIHRESEGTLDVEKKEWAKPRILINNDNQDSSQTYPLLGQNGELRGIFHNYLLVRSYPNLRILFASPSLQVPGILQSPFIDKIGGSSLVRDELTQALADGRAVTAKVQWVAKQQDEGQKCWIHCTPLFGNNGSIGVWMVIIVDDETFNPDAKQYRMPPPVDPPCASRDTERGNN